MDGRYPQNNPPYGGYYGIPPPQVAPAETYPSQRHPLQPTSTESGGGLEGGDPSQAAASQAAPSRPRRRSTLLQKHRRTRSGCYTCRQRRVKCDETRPTCDRCLKGKRECVYPDSASSSKTAKSALKSKDEADSPSSHSNTDTEDAEANALAAIPDEEEHSTIDSSSANEAQRSRQSSDLSALTSGKIAAPTGTSEASTQSKRGRGRPRVGRTSSQQQVRSNITEHPRWSSLPSDVKWYLKYHRNNLSHHHYGFKVDSTNFLKDVYLHIAIGDEALLYAVVAFAAYFNTLTREDGKAQEFLQYYDRSVTALRSYLQQKGKLRTSTLLTILQLATIEEFLGDWNSLVNHQRAAYTLIIQLYTPETSMLDDTRRRIIGWYVRFDLFAGIMSGSETTLDREWFTATAEFYRRQARDRPQDLVAQFEDLCAKHRLLAKDSTTLFAQKAKGDTSDEDLDPGVQEIARGLSDFAKELEARFLDASIFLEDFSGASEPSEDNIVDIRQSRCLYGGEFYTLNIVYMDHWGLDLNFRYQLAMMQGQAPGPELAELALKKCRVIEAVQHYDQAPPGAMLGLQASLAISALCLPKDKKHANWLRRKFALMEQKGYIYPETMRRRMGEMWNEDVSRWWLPNGEGLTAPVSNIREFVASRAQEQTPTHVSELSGMFRSLSVQQQSPADSRSTTSSELPNIDPMDRTLVYESSPDNTGRKGSI